MTDKPRWDPSKSRKPGPEGPTGQEKHPAQAHELGIPYNATPAEMAKWMDENPDAAKLWEQVMWHE